MTYTASQPSPAPAQVREQVIRCGPLVGVLTQPTSSVGQEGPCVVFLNAGLVHRVGPGRLYVQLARELANLGWRSLRFDFSGIGDSDPTEDPAPVNHRLIQESNRILEELAARHGCREFLLVGLCSGAGFAFRVAQGDSRVTQLVLINPAAHRWSHPTLERKTLLRHYRRLVRRRPWRKLLTLNFDVREVVRTLTGAATDMVRSEVHDGEAHTSPPEIRAGLAELLERRVRTLLVYSGGDEGLDYFDAYLRGDLPAWQATGYFEIHRIDGANHTFTLRQHQEELIRRVCDFAAAPQGTEG